MSSIAIVGKTYKHVNINLRNILSRDIPLGK